MSPSRVQLKRTKGYRKPEDAIVVARPTKWGNPIPWQGSWIIWTAAGLGYRADAAGRRSAAVAIYRSWLLQEPVALGPYASDSTCGSIVFGSGREVTINEHVMGISRFMSSMYDAPTMPDRPPVEDLRDRDLACWCPLDQPCHADVLLEVANA